MTPLVLVAEPDPSHRRILEDAFKSAGHRVVSVDSGQAVLDRVAREKPDLILMARDLPFGDGIEVLRLLRADAHYADVGILIATDRDDLDGAAPAIAAGADDCVTRPYRVVEVQQRVRNALRLRAAENAIAYAMSDAERTDLASGLGTRAHLDICLDYEIARAQRNGCALSCVVVRVVNYKQCLRDFETEDAHTLISELALGLSHSLRQVDQIFRHADDEFVLVLPETDETAVRIVIERMRESVHGEAFWKDAPPMLPRIAIGASTLPALATALNRDLVAEAVMQVEHDPILRDG
ncbi:MAG: response regulator [Sandaracinaceae bacterium]|nr:response regulator [Sandaracinaceae bacterium]